MCVCVCVCLCVYVGIHNHNPTRFRLCVFEGKEGVCVCVCVCVGTYTCKQTRKWQVNKKIKNASFETHYHVTKYENCGAASHRQKSTDR